MRSKGFPAVVCRPAVALPPYRLGREELVCAARARLGEGFPHLRQILKIIENSGVDCRYLARPLEETLESADFGARNDRFIAEAKRLGEAAAREALEEARITAEDVDLIITTSCTGIMIPSLCAHLVGTMGFRPQTKRLPINALGCAGGAAAFSRAREFCQAYPGANALIVAVELCSLTYQPTDLSMQALVGAMLFGDGAAACVVRGSNDRPGLRLEASESLLFEDSWHYMGFDVRASGLHLVLDKGIPAAVETKIGPALRRFVEKNGLAVDDVDFFCIHPGGRRVIDEIEAFFGIGPSATAASRDCLAEIGNISSASILVVLRNLFDRYCPRPGDSGLVAAFGPGFAAEMCLATWNGAA